MLRASLPSVPFRFQRERERVRERERFVWRDFYPGCSLPARAGVILRRPLRALDNGRARFFISFLMTPRTRFSSQLLRRAARRDSRGFTLLEILLAVAILGMLVGLAITNVGGIFSSNQEKIAQIFVTQSLEAPLQSYRMTMGNYPSTADGLQALITPPADKADRWRGPYIKDDSALLLDPWKNPYQYRFPGVRNRTGYDVWSKGPDGQDGTTDDIGNWSTAAPGAAAQ